MPDGTYTSDEPYAWDAREFLRKKLVGKEVAFRVEYKLPFGKSPKKFHFGLLFRCIIPFYSNYLFHF